MTLATVNTPESEPPPCRNATSGCSDEPFYKFENGIPYCVLHYPGPGKEEPFREALSRLLKCEEYNFRSVYFPEDFSADVITFKRPVDLSRAIFNGDAIYKCEVHEAN